MTKFEKAYEVAFKEFNQAEVAGVGNNLRILEYAKATSLKASDDETPWCSAFVNWVLAQIGEPGTNSAAAKSFLNWGVQILAPVQGCVAVFTRGEGGHVAFVDRVEGETIYCLGGNQSNRVCIAPYPASRLLMFRGFRDAQGDTA